jgi:hypothetical protein
MTSLYRAQNVAPKDESIYKSTSSVTLKWAPGPNTPGTPKYTVYYAYNDSNWADVNDGTATNVTRDVNYYSIGAVVGGENYYWRVDTNSAGTIYRGNIWTFQVQPLAAWGPNPTNNYQYVPIDPNLSWEAGSNAIWGHRVFFDTSYTAVRDASTDPCITVLPYRAKLAVADTNWAPSEYPGLAPLDVNTYYYWRVDEVNRVSPTKVVTKGTVWNFRTVPIVGLGTISPAVMFPT